MPVLLLVAGSDHRGCFWTTPHGTAAARHSICGARTPSPECEESSGEIDSAPGLGARTAAVLPYFPYVRSDKKDRPRISITARLMADLLQTAGADRILTMNLHSPQVQGFFRIPADQLQAAPILCDYLRQSRDLANYVLVAGDVGESKDVGHYAARLDLPIAIVDKRRYGDDEAPRAVNLIGDVKGKVALIVDDEVASGGTLVEAARFVLEH